MSNFDKKSGGFSAIELLVIIVLLSIVFSAFASSYNLISQANKKSQHMNIASNLAFSKLQEYKNKQFGTIGGDSSSQDSVVVEDFAKQFPDSFVAPKTATVSVSNQSEDIKQIIVRVNYGRDGDIRKINYIDFVRRGD